VHYNKLGLKGLQSRHGWRATFKTLAMEKYEEHNIPSEYILAHLNHKMGHSNEDNYTRSKEFLSIRLKLMKWWENFLSN